MSRRRRQPSNPLARPDRRFEGSRYSTEECEFLLEHLGKLSVEALGDPDDELPEGVNEAAVAPILDRTYELEKYQQSLREKTGDPEVTVWCGFDKLRAILRETIDWRRQCDELKRRTKGSAPELRMRASNPSLCMWDRSTDTAVPYGIGADAGIVQTALNEHGQRVELYTDLRNTGEGSIKTLAGVAKFVKAQSDAEASAMVAEGTPEELVVDEGETFGTVACPICGFSETFEVAKPTTKQMAQRKVIRHLKEEKVRKVEQHRILHQRMTSGRVGASRNRVQAGLGMTGAEA